MEIQELRQPSQNKFNFPAFKSATLTTIAGFLFPVIFIHVATVPIKGSVTFGPPVENGAPLNAVATTKSFALCPVVRAAKDNPALPNGVITSTKEFISTKFVGNGPLVWVRAIVP